MTKPDRRQAESGFEGTANTPSDDTREPEQLSFLPAPEFKPTWPELGTLAADALARLLSGERLTQPAFGLTRWRLAAYIRTLKDLDWPVRSAPIHYPGRSRPIAEYWLSPDAITAARAMRGAA